MSRRWIALGVLCTSLLAIVVDNTIVNVALPTLVRELDAELTDLQWVVDAYTLVFAGLLLLGGALGDRYGRRRMLLAGLVVFALSSAAAAFAGNVEQLIAARAVMGAGAAFIMPATLSLLISVFEDPRERATAIGLWAATAGVGVALGPVAGGFLLDHFAWGSIFIVNVPLCLAALVVGPRVIAESLDPAAPRVDWLGAALSGVGLLALVWAVIEAPSEGWTSPGVLAAFVLAAALLAGFAVQQRRVTQPLLDLALFRNPRFSAASSTIMVLFFALFGFLFLCHPVPPVRARVLAVRGRRAGAAVRRRDDRVRGGVREARRALRDQARGDDRDAAVRAGPRRRGDGGGDRRLRPARHRARAHGRGHGPRGRARD